MIRVFSLLLAVALCTAVMSPGQAQSDNLVRFTGQILDVRNGYVYFTTGDAFKLITAPRIASYETGQATTLQPAPKLFARAILDPATHQVVELDLTRTKLAMDKAYASAKASAVVTSTAQPAPEIAGGTRITGKLVPVLFEVTVPPNTPGTADVFVSTDVSGWNPQAIKLDRVDGQHYRSIIRFASGTRFAYRVTRGSWQSVEIGQDGLEAAPHPFFVKEVDSQAATPTVYAWADQRPNQSAPQPGAIPTPFNPNPFNNGGIFPGPGPKVTPPGGFPTPSHPRNPNVPPGAP